MNPSPLTGRAQLDATGAALRDVLVRLFHYRKTRAQHLDPKSPYFENTQKHLADIDKLLLAVNEYSSAVEACLPEEAPQPTWMLNPNPTPAERQAELESIPEYRLGYVRGYKRGYGLAESRYERLTSLYAQYAILVPPPGYTPSPLVQRVNRFLDSPEMQARAALPLETRQALAGIAAHNLPSQEHQLWA